VCFRKRLFELCTRSDRSGAIVSRCLGGGVRFLVRLLGGTLGSRLWRLEAGRDALLTDWARVARLQSLGSVGCGVLSAEAVERGGGGRQSLLGGRLGFLCRLCSVLGAVELTLQAP